MSGPNISCERKHKQILKRRRLLATGFKNSRHFLNQSEVKPKPMAIRSPVFSRAFCQLHVLRSSFDWFAALSVSFMIDQSTYWLYGTQSKTSLKLMLQLQLFLVRVMVRRASFPVPDT